MWYVLKRDMDKPSMEIIGRFKIPVNASEIMLKDVREYIDIPDEAMMEIRNGEYRDLLEISNLYNDSFSVLDTSELKTSFLVDQVRARMLLKVEHLSQGD